MLQQLNNFYFEHCCVLCMGQLLQAFKENTYNPQKLDRLMLAQSFVTKGSEVPRSREHDKLN